MPNLFGSAPFRLLWEYRDGPELQLNSGALCGIGGPQVPSLAVRDIRRNHLRTVDVEVIPTESRKLIRVHTASEGTWLGSGLWAYQLCQRNDSPRIIELVHVKVRLWPYGF